jgi:pyruvate kinase
MVEKPFEAKKKDIIILTPEEVIGSETTKRLSISHKDLPKEVKSGSKLFINDGLVGLNVLKVENNEIICEVFAEGPISSKKGINAPDIPLSIFFPTPKDLDDAKFTLENFNPEPDFFAISFIRKPEDVKEIKNLISERYKKTKLIGKIEHRDALDNIDAIFNVCDGVMVARGDLGIEVPTEDVPIIQKELIKKGNQLGKPVITATQMLESMTFNKRPTRAEAGDVSNAVLDGTDAVMLSGETASGNYPIDAIEYMDRIAKRAENNIFQSKNHEMHFKDANIKNPLSISENLGFNAYSLSNNLPIKAILAITRTGTTAQIISKFRPKSPILACTGDVNTARQLRLVWGVDPIVIPVVTSTEELIFRSVITCVNLGYLEEVDQVIIIAGTLLGVPAKTNLLQILHVSDVLSLKSRFEE